MYNSATPLRSPPPPPKLPDFSSQADSGGKLRATNAVLKAPELQGPLKEIVDIMAPLRSPPAVRPEKRKTPPMPAVLGLPNNSQNTSIAAPAASDVDSAIMAKALQAVNKPRLSLAPKGLHPGMVSVPARKPLKSAKSSSHLVQALIEETRTTSSAEAMTTLHGATAGMDTKQRRAYMLKRRADEARVQQLRGIFAAFDANRDGQLNKSELSNALLALGISPTPAIISRFSMTTDKSTVDLTTVHKPQNVQFVRVTMTQLPDYTTTEETIATLFKEFDKEDTGRIPLSALLHLLCEVEQASSLNVEEVNEVLKLSGIMSELQARDASVIYATEVDHKALLKHMMFPMPKHNVITAEELVGGAR